MWILGASRVVNLKIQKVDWVKPGRFVQNFHFKGQLDPVKCQIYVLELGVRVRMFWLIVRVGVSELNLKPVDLQPWVKVMIQLLISNQTLQ